MGGHRGDFAVKQLGPTAVREILVACVAGVVAGGAWWAVARAEHKSWDVINKNYQLQKVERRKQFQAWLQTQPFDDETA